MRQRNTKGGIKMINDIIINLFNRMPVSELVKRNEEEGVDYIIEDGKITRVISVQGKI